MQQVSGNFSFVALLLEGNTEYLLVLQQLRLVVFINLNDVVGAFAFALQNGKSLFSITGCDNTVRNLACQHFSGLHVANIGQSNKVAIGAHAVSAAGTCISICQRRQLQVVYIINLFQSITQRQASCSTCRAYVLKGCCCRQTCCFLQFFYQLPAVESIKEIDVAGAAVQYLNRQLAAIVHVNTCAALIRIAAIF